MKRLIFFSCCLLLALNATAQTKAITDNGKEVLLFENGTWKYLDDSAVAKVDSIVVNPQKFSKSPDANFLVKSKVFNVGININPSKWAFVANKNEEKPREYQFTFKPNDAYAMLITEDIGVDLDQLRSLALLNAKKASADMKEVFSEYRMVNGNKVLCLELRGTVHGLKFVYLGYYFSNENGTAQLISWTFQKNYAQLKKELATFLNGLTELKK